MQRLFTGFDKNFARVNLTQSFYAYMVAKICIVIFFLEDKVKMEI